MGLGIGIRLNVVVWDYDWGLRLKTGYSGLRFGIGIRYWNRDWD